MIIKIGDWQIRPTDGHRDWSIWQYRDVVSKRGESKGEVRTEWVHTGRYAETLEVAFMRVYELALKEGSEMVEAIEAMKEVKACKREIIKALEDAGVK